MISLMGTLLVGLMVGLLARAFKPGHDTLGWVMHALLGVAGSLLATYIGLAMGWYQYNEALGWVAAATGAMGLLAIFSLVNGKT